MIRTLLIALLIAFPAFAAEDFTERSTCKGHWGTFTDGQVSSAEQDNCDGIGDQDGDNDIEWLANTAVDDGNAPSLAPADSDSTEHIFGDGLTSGYATNSEEWGFTDFTFLAWYELTDSTYTSSLMYYKTTNVTPGSYSLRCTAANITRGRVSGTYQRAGPGGAACPDDTWMFLGLRYDGSVDNRIVTYASTGAGIRSLVDCDGAGDSVCNTEATGPSDHANLVQLHATDAGGGRFDGHQQESALFAEALTHEGVCQFCRCGGRSDVRGVGRVDACNRCDVPAYQGCRRIID